MLKVQLYGFGTCIVESSYSISICPWHTEEVYWVFPLPHCHAKTTMAIPQVCYTSQSLCTNNWWACCCYCMYSSSWFQHVWVRKKSAVWSLRSWHSELQLFRATFFIMHTCVFWTVINCSLIYKLLIVGAVSWYHKFVLHSLAVAWCCLVNYAIGLSILKKDRGNSLHLHGMYLPLNFAALCATLVAKTLMYMYIPTSKYPSGICSLLQCLYSQWFS